MVMKGESCKVETSILKNGAGDFEFTMRNIKSKAYFPSQPGS